MLDAECYFQGFLTPSESLRKLTCSPTLTISDYLRLSHQPFQKRCDHIISLCSQSCAQTHLTTPRVTSPKLRNSQVDGSVPKKGDWMWVPPGFVVRRPFPSESLDKSQSSWWDPNAAWGPRATPHMESLQLHSPLFERETIEQFQSSNYIHNASLCKMI